MYTLWATSRIMSNYNTIFGLVHAIPPHCPWASQGITLFCTEEEKTYKQTTQTKKQKPQHTKNTKIQQTNRATVASSSSFSRLPFSSCFLGSTAELTSFLNTDTRQGCSCRCFGALILLSLEHTTIQRSPLLGPGLQKLWNPPLLAPLPSAPAERGDPLPAQAQRKNTE